MPSIRPQIAVYYFPNYHPDPRNAAVHGPGWTEWELVRRAEPRYPGHRQPRIPAWGYEDESDPAAMAKKIAAAADHGIDAFLFDWYSYSDGPFLERALEQGFFNAPNRGRLKFAIHWANHNWTDIHPAKLDEVQRLVAPEGGQLRASRLLYPGAMDAAAFLKMTDLVIERYFRHPCYWTLDGAPYFSIYDLPELIRGLGGVESARAALADFRRRTVAAGFPGLHLNQVLWNRGILPGESAVRQPGELLKQLGFDSFTSYVWIHHVPLPDFPASDYWAAFQGYLDYWQSALGEIDLPYFPNATVGWDSSPRTLPSDAWLNAGYPYTPVLEGATPANFRRALEEIRARMERINSPRVLTINAWNEWTEGSYLEPDTENGMSFLEAIRDVLA
jgi:hypothetical protein